MKNENPQEKAPVDYGTPMIAWRAPEFKEHERGQLWIFAMSVLAIGLIIYGILTDSIAFSVVIILVAGVFFLTHNHKPQIVEVIITDLGIKFGERFYSFEDVKVFWIIFDPPHVKTLNFRTSRGVVREVCIQLEDQNPSEIRAFLGAHLSEWKNRTETLAEILIRILKL